MYYVNADATRRIQEEHCPKDGFGCCSCCALIDASHKISSEEMILVTPELKRKISSLATASGQKVCEYIEALIERDTKRKEN